MAWHCPLHLETMSIKLSFQRLSCPYLSLSLYHKLCINMLHFKILSFLSFGFQWLEIILSVWYISPCVPGLGNSTFSFQCEVTLTLQGCGLAQGRFSDFQPNIYTTWELRDLLSGHTVLLGCHKQIESTLHGVPNKKLNITPLNLVFSQIFKNNHLYSG